MLKEKGTNHNKPLIFISYPSERREQAQYLSEFLEEKCFETWVDFKNIPASGHYNREIVEAIRKSDAVVVLVCRDSDKEKGNIERELNEALNNKKPILPLAVENIQAEELVNIGYYVNLPQWRYWLPDKRNELNILVNDLRKVSSHEGKSHKAHEQFGEQTQNADTDIKTKYERNITMKLSCLLHALPIIMLIVAAYYSYQIMKMSFLSFIIMFIIFVCFLGNILIEMPFFIVASIVTMLTLTVYQYVKPPAPTTLARITMMVKGNDVELHAFPRLDKYLKTEQLDSGDLVEAAEQSIQEENAWYHIYTFDGRSGWVLEQYLQRVPETPFDPDDVFYIASRGTVADIHNAINRGLNFNIANSFGYTPLHRAVMYNENPEVVRLLIQQGLDVNATRTMGINPGTLLEDAARKNQNPEVIRILLENGAKISSSRGKHRALELAVISNTNPEVTKILLDAEDEATRELLLNGTIRFQRMGFIGDGFWRENKSEFDIPLLGCAAKNGNTRITKFLLEQGAEVNAKNSEGITVLITAAAFSQSPEVINLLVKAGADINAQDDIGRTALIEAVHVDSKPEIVELLINAGADVNHQDIYGETALMCVASRPNYSHEDKNYYDMAKYKNEIVKLLIRAGANVNIHNKDGDTALMKAAVSIMDTQDKTVEILLKAGADLHAVNHDGKTAFDLLSEDSATSIRNLLNPNTSPFRNASFDINAL